MQVTVSPKFQVVIPKEVRRAANVRPGQKLEVLYYGDQIHLVPVTSMRAARGFARGIDTTVERDEDRV